MEYGLIREKRHETKKIMIPAIFFKGYNFRCHPSGEDKDKIMNGLEAEQLWVLMLTKIKMTWNLYDSYDHVLQI